MEQFTEKVIETIRNIPEGQVMTYGQVARLSGNKRAARQVARILHTMSRKHHLPWHRVINAQGIISIKEEEGSFTQAIVLEEEGVQVINGRISLHEYQVQE